jgi:hypothetical protein
MSVTVTGQEETRTALRRSKGWPNYESWFQNASPASGTDWPNINERKAQPCS